MSITAIGQRGTALLLILTLCWDGCQSKSEERKVEAEEIKKAEGLLIQQFPVLGKPGVPSPVPITDAPLSRAFRQYHFFAVILPQYPVARVPPEPLKSQNLFSVNKDGKVLHVQDTKALEHFFRTTLRPVMDQKAAKDDAEAWLRLTQEFKQDGFFKFSIPKESLVAEKSDGGWVASGKAVVTEGGKGEIRAELSFAAGKLTEIKETSTVKAGIRPRCQATKLLDPDPVVREMAEKDILVMGQACKEYLDEQRAKVSPDLKKAIDGIWQRIIKEGW